MSESKETNRPIYSVIDYPKGHFSLSNGHGEKWFVMALRYKNGPCYLIKANPSDARGLRSIVVLITPDAADMHTTINRPYTLLEKQGLLYVASLVAHVCETCFGVVVQVEMAGNNAHDFKENKVILGKSSEPIMNHLHLICRGNPNHAYISELPDLKLGGPVPGEMFNMRGDAKEGDPGNMSKVKWPSPEHMKMFATILNKNLLLQLEGMGELEIISVLDSRI